MNDQKINHDMATNIEAKTVLLGHGSGGKLSHELLHQVFFPHFTSLLLREGHDGAVFKIGSETVAFSTDSFVVDPFFFPGGNIGDLAVNGTINDLSMCGAIPLFISAGFILEEGFSLMSLKEIVNSMQKAAEKAGVQIVTGDTKVVQNGKGDGIFINTTGIGVVPEAVSISPKNANPGDKIIINGPIADHGVTIMLEREKLDFEIELFSDTAPLNSLVQGILEVSTNIRVLRDPTRGGIASSLNEIATASKRGIVLDESVLPIREEVAAACEILGLDPLHIANEGKVLVFVNREETDAVLSRMMAHPLGKNAVIIGEVTENHPGKVILKTEIGSTRVVDMLVGDQLPRIC